MIETMNIKPSVTRKNIRLVRDTSRVITRLHVIEDTPRISKIIDHVIHLNGTDAELLKNKIIREFSHRHKDIHQICYRQFERVSQYVPANKTVSDLQKFLIGAYMTMEYSIESAALFNPSIVPHPDQTNLPEGHLRFIMSLRATGEGHISSIVFRTGVIEENNAIVFETASRFAETPELRLPARNDRNAVDSNYIIQFQPDQKISERVIFPITKNEIKGIEDARFVRFVDDSGEITYYATYTAYDGFKILPRLIETKDFTTFNVVTLSGNAVKNKGMALFPRKINGKYVMLSRQDGENNRIMFSENIHLWEESSIVQEPASPWEYIQIGNCGSPIETEKGWLVLTHGVGPMRQYSIGAILLDLTHPEKLIARLEDPLITPTEEEREGYVPNVVYSCGSLIHNKTLIVPYAMSDISSGVATVEVNELLNCMRPLQIGSTKK
jgi:predicted GH43/DUF377 family glycosyl hydrolase